MVVDAVDRYRPTIADPTDKAAGVILPLSALTAVNRSGLIEK
jgi:hypothetical protein